MVKLLALGCVLVVLSCAHRPAPECAQVIRVFMCEEKAAYQYCRVGLDDGTRSVTQGVASVYDIVCWYRKGRAFVRND